MAAEHSHLDQKYKEVPSGSKTGGASQSCVFARTVQGAVSCLENVTVYDQSMTALGLSFMSGYQRPEVPSNRWEFGSSAPAFTTKLQPKEFSGIQRLPMYMPRKNLVLGDESLVSYKEMQISDNDRGHFEEEGLQTNSSVQTVSGTEQHNLSVAVQEENLPHASPSLSSTVENVHISDYISDTVLQREYKSENGGFLNMNRAEKDSKHAVSLSENIASNELEDLLIELSETEAEYPISPESKNIREDVETMISGVCDYLRQSYRMFTDCKLLKTGSTYEQLKIGEPDEFDFMIELPALADEKALEFYQCLTDIHAELVSYRVNNFALFEDIFQVSEDENLEQFMSGVLDAAEAAINDKLPSLLLPGWAFILDPKLSAGRQLIPRMAFTPVLEWHGKEFHNLFVSIDIAFAVPLRKYPIWELGRRIYLGASSNEVVLPDAVEVYYALLRDYKTCRISFSLKEQEIMRQYPLGSGQNRCLRLLKYLRNALSTKKFDEKALELMPLISTYWFKTIMYFQFKKYENEPSMWINGQLSERIMEALNELSICIRASNLQSFFIPNYNLFLMKFLDAGKQDALIRDVEELLRILTDLKLSNITKNDLIRVIEEKKRQNEAILYKERRSYLMDLLYVYAYNNYESVGLETIRGFVERYFRGSFQIIGQGKEISLLENNEMVDIDRELEKQYDEKFSYFTR